MQVNYRISALIIFLMLAMSLGVVVFHSPATTAIEAGESPNLSIHFNMKDDDDTLTPQTKADRSEQEATKTVRAQYDDGIILRANRDWVSVGTWTTDEVKYDQDININTVNLWWEEDGSSSDNDADWRFTVNHNDEQVGEYTVTEQDEHENGVVEETFDSSDGFDVPTISLLKGDTISVFIEYQGWEDIVLHYDNATYDSGFMVNAKPVTFFDVKKDNKKVTFEFVEAWTTNWNDNIRGEYIVLVEADNTLNTRAQASQGEERTVANGTQAQSTIITWSDVISDEVTLLMDYDVFDPFQNGSADSAVVNLYVTTSTTDSNNEKGFLPGLGFGGALVALAAATALIASRRRGS